MTTVGVEEVEGRGRETVMKKEEGGMIIVKMGNN